MKAENKAFLESLDNTKNYVVAEATISKNAEAIINKHLWEDDNAPVLKYFFRSAKKTTIRNQVTTEGIYNKETGEFFFFDSLASAWMLVEDYELDYIAY